MLQEYFEQRRLLLYFDWDDGDIEPLYSAWMGLPAQEHRAVSVDFQRLTSLCSKQGIQTLLDVGRSAGFDLVPVMAQEKSNVAKVFRVLLDRPDLFRIASLLMCAHNLKRYWYRRRDLPQLALDLSEPALAELKRALSAHYVLNQDRGEYCHIEVYPRGDQHYVMVYLADYPSMAVCFENSDQLNRSLQQQAFDVVFIFDPAQGRLDLYAEGTCELRNELGQMFARHLLRQEVTLDTVTGPLFNIGPLKDPSFRFRIDPSDGISWMRVKSIRLSACGREPGVGTFETVPRTKDDNLYAFLQRALNTKELPLEELRVERVTIQAQFSRGDPRPPSVTFSIGSNSCNLKDTPEHNKIRECLRRSEILRG
jgi:hypothetical protein